MGKALQVRSGERCGTGQWKSIDETSSALTATTSATSPPRSNAICSPPQYVRKELRERVGCDRPEIVGIRGNTPSTLLARPPLRAFVHPVKVPYFDFMSAVKGGILSDICVPEGQRLALRDQPHSMSVPRASRRHV